VLLPVQQQGRLFERIHQIVESERDPFDAGPPHHFDDDVVPTVHDVANEQTLVHVDAISLTPIPCQEPDGSAPPRMTWSVGRGVAAMFVDADHDAGRRIADLHKVGYLVGEP
jgi:hypothetical protein